MPEGEEYAVLHVITESEGVAVSTSSSSTAATTDEQWVCASVVNPAPVCFISHPLHVLLHLDGELLCTAAAGNCSACCFMPITRLGAGLHVLSAELADADGNVLATGRSRFRIIDAY